MLESAVQPENKRIGMVFIPFASVAELNAVQPLKQESPTDVSVPGMLIFVRDLQSANANRPNVFSPSGRIMLFKLLQRSKTSGFITFRFWGNFTVFNLLQYRKAYISISSTESGKTIFSILVDWNAEFPITVIEDGKLISNNEVQLANIPCGSFFNLSDNFTEDKLVISRHI